DQANQSEERQGNVGTLPATGTFGRPFRQKQNPVSLQKGSASSEVLSLLNTGQSHGSLNVFQRTMLHWDELHPYNAVHVVRVFELLDPKRLNSTINATLERQGLTRLVLNT